ncbi:hypothetical protein AY555_00495 [Haematospirillum jordaniae]|uniref:LPS-assembly protein LptD n=2 Tax=Haematospirillum jordaniae TaxID=1549855 RepID=A0A143DCQ5_9PROT|nr:hypothetical protein AY555_00495 [Haematospirillum jordaniae]
MTRRGMLPSLSPLTRPIPSFLSGMMVCATAIALCIPQQAWGQMSAPPPAESRAEEQKPRAHVTADELIHDKNLDTVTARGNVEFQYGAVILIADTISYQPGKDLATASGNVVLTDEDGTTTFTDYAELTGDLKNGFTHAIKVVLADGSRSHAEQAVRREGTSTTLENAAYTPCDSCGDDPVIWQIKAVRVVHDQNAREVRYNHAWLELFDVPVLYTPYLSHPDPAVKRKSGFLVPSWKNDKDLGSAFSIPWFQVINDQQDITLTPTITSKEGIVLGSQYRVVGHKAALTATGSITRDSRERVRNHLSAKGIYAINDTWRAGADIDLASDPTYLRRYGFGAPAFLENRGYIEGFSRRSYAALESFYFQNTGAPLKKGYEIPFVTPLGSINYSTEPDSRGAWTTLDISAASVNRTSGPKSQRATTTLGWHLPYVGPAGDVWRLDTSLRGDVWRVADVPIKDNADHRYTGTIGRAVPEAALTWSLPLERTHEDWSEVLEPTIQGVISPRGGNNRKVPNEDSLDFELDDVNLFSTNRFTGYDRIEGGTRINYGVRYTAYGTRVGTIDTLAGQTWRQHPDGLFQETSGLHDTFSDYVGRLSVYPNNNFSTSWRFRLDRDNGEIRRNDFSTTIGPDVMRTTVGYVSTQRPAIEDNTAGERKEFYSGVSSRISQYWSSGVSGRWDVARNGGPIATRGQLAYEDECIGVTFQVGRRYTYDRDYTGGTFIGLVLSLKTLGDYNTQL